MTTTRICGNGAACENICPLMRAGRQCPTFQEIAEACETLRISPWPILAQLAVARQ